MLVLSRRLNEKILLPTLDVSVQVVAINKGSVRIGIQAPPHVRVLREELQARQAEWAAPPAPPPDKAPEDATAAARLQRLSQLVGNRLKVTSTGISALRRQLAEGSLENMATTLEKLEEDIQLLRRRIEEDDKKDSPRPARRPHALLVEDNQHERELLAALLRKQGLDVVTADDGADALDYLSDHHGEPDVLLLDMGLPRCDGASVVRTLRRDPAYSDLKIFAVSGHSPDEYDVARGPAGIDRWFPKPINPVELVANVYRELTCHNGHRPNPR